MNIINIGTEINLQDLIQSRMLIQANSGGGKSALARTIIEQSFGKVPFIILDKEGEYYTLKEKFGDILIIGGTFADVPINLKSASLLPKEIISNRLSVIIDLSDLKSDEKRKYVKLFLESMMNLSKEYWIAYLVFIEEAHFFAGEQDMYESGPAVKELMSAGRKRGYCGILLTQRISKLHKDAAAECNNKFIGRTVLDIDMDRSARELGFSNKLDRLKLRDLQPGHFYAFGTSIEPVYVHEVTINLPATKLPKAGSDLHIQPKKPTDKIKYVLTKLNDLPQEAAKELKTMQDLQTEVNRLKTELSKVTKFGTGLHSEKDVNQISTLKSHNLQLKQELLEKDKKIAAGQKALNGYLAIIKGIGRMIEKTEPATTTEGPLRIITKSVVPVTNAFVDHNKKFADKVYGMVNKNAAPPEKLGKCALNLLQFLATFQDRSFSKAQLGIATGYSPGSGGFNNSLSELNSKGLIKRDSGKIQLNDVDNITDWAGDFEPQQYSIHTYLNKLSKCEKEIYQVLLDNTQTLFSKEELADMTESKYSFSSGGFNNALSTLNTLELIKREGGRIRLNPELLEI